MTAARRSLRAGSGIVSVLAVAGIVGSLMRTLVVPLVGQLPRLLDATAADTSWVITVTLLVGAVATPVAGKLGDLRSGCRSRRRSRSTRTGGCRWRAVRGRAGGASWARAMACPIVPVL
ncbi:hypothetical protein [Nonomuraea polychroma]